MRPSCKGMTSLHLKRCQKPTFISLVKLKQADWLQARKEPRWRIKTNRPAALRQQEQPHGHIRGGSVSQVNQNKGTGLTQKCQVYSLLLAIRAFNTYFNCQDSLWQNFILMKENFAFRSGGTKMQTHRLWGDSTHCSKSSFFVHKFNFDFPRKLSIFQGEKLVNMLWFWTF